MFTWDEAKRQANLAKHGVDFTEAERFDWSTSVRYPDLRRDYGEDRMRATGLIGDRVHVLVYTIRNGQMRIIGLRKANKREVLEWLNERK